jgi:hypothetical protein
MEGRVTMKMIFAMRDDKNKPHVYRIDTAVSQKAIECLPTEWAYPVECTALAAAIIRWFGLDDGTDYELLKSTYDVISNPNGWTISDDFRQWHAPDLVSPAPEVETGDWQGADTTRHPDEPDGRDIISDEGTNR